MEKTELKRWSRAAELLEQVLDLPDAQQEAAVEELGEQNGVRHELASLYESSAEESVLDETLDSMLQNMPGAVPERNALKGQILENWELGDEIGHGGMSVVYHASRTGQEFDQHAALKILSVGHFGDDFVAGFVRERQILSDLHHPGIARLIDGGITPEAAPFLVMQFVKGERIDRWCEQRGCGSRAITQLMQKLCHAVAYAHRHLVVHQDIKPANVLVDEHDQPILIDFGIATLLSQSEDAQTIQAFTPHFSAPEQSSGGVITTATDVYALGKLFRSLLQEHPVDQDLEAILNAATHEDPEERYANARNLSDDLQAWLDKRPVKARAPTVGYRAVRFIARNRWGVAAAAVIVMSLVAGLSTALWQARIAAAERDVAQAESARATQAIEFLKELFRASDPDRSRGEVVTARELLDQGAHQVRNAMQGTPALQAEMMILLGDLFRELGESDAAGPLLEEGLQLADGVGAVELRADARRVLALNHMESGAHEEALALAEQASQMLDEQGLVPGRLHAELQIPTLYSLAELGRVPEAVERGEAVLSLVRENAGLPEVARFHYLSSVGNIVLIAEQLERASELLFEAVEIAPGSEGSPSLQITLQSNVAGILDRRGEHQAALEYRRRVVLLVEEIYPPVHPVRARMLSNLGATLVPLGLHGEAGEVLREALAIYEQIHKEEAHPRVGAAHNNLARALEQAGDFEGAELHMVRGRDIAAELFGKNDPRYVIATGNLGGLYRDLGKFEAAERLLLENLELRRALLGPDHPSVGIGISMISALRLEQERWEEALELGNEALTQFDRVGFTNIRAVLATRVRHARALAGLGRNQEAEQAFTEALQFVGTNTADAGRQWLALLAAQAEFLVARMDPGADAAVDRALQAHREMLGDEHPSTRDVRLLGQQQ